MSLHDQLNSNGTGSDSLTGFLLRTFIAGLVAIGVALIIEAPFGLILNPDANFYGSVLMASIVAPTVEETIKAYSAVKIGKLIHAKTGFWVGLFFGLTETLLYVFSFSTDTMSAMALFTLRLFVSVPLHTADTAMFLYGLSNRKRPGWYNRIIYAYLLHGLFNFAVTAG